MKFKTVAAKGSSSKSVAHHPGLGFDDFAGVDLVARPPGDRVPTIAAASVREFAGRTGLTTVLAAETTTYTLSVNTRGSR